MVRPTADEPHDDSDRRGEAGEPSITMRGGLWPAGCGRCGLGSAARTASVCSLPNLKTDTCSFCAAVRATPKSYFSGGVFRYHN